MPPLPTTFLEILISWLVIFVFLLVKLRTFPLYKYEDLKRSHPLEQPPQRAQYYWIPHPMVWASIAFAMFSVGYVYYIRQNPSAFLDLLDKISGIIAWMNDAPNGSPVVVPLNPVWASVGLTLAIYLLQSLLSLICNEVSQNYFPQYTLDHWAGQLGKLRERFDKEKPKSKERRVVISLHIAALILLVTTYISLRTPGDLMWYGTAPGLLFIISVILYLSAPERNFRSEQIRKLFDAKKLSIYWRRKFWRAALKAWIVIPLLLIIIAINLEAFTLEVDGIHKFYRLRQIVVNWLEIKSLNMGFEDSKIKDPKQAQNIQKPRLYVRITLEQITTDLNEYGVFEINPRTFVDMLSQFERHDITPSCQLDENSRALKSLYIKAKTERPLPPGPYREMVESIEKLCK